MRPIPTREQDLEPQSAILTDDEIPKNGIVITIDSERIGYWQLGDTTDEVQTCGMAVYRLLSYFSGDGVKVRRAVDGITGRVN